MASLCEGRELAPSYADAEVDVDLPLASIAEGNISSALDDEVLIRIASIELTGDAVSAGRDARTGTTL